MFFVFFWFWFVLVFLFCFLFVLFGYVIIKIAYKVIKVRAKEKKGGTPRAKKFPSMPHTSLTEEAGTPRTPDKKDENTQWLPQHWGSNPESPSQSHLPLSPDTLTFVCFPASQTLYPPGPHTLLFAKKNVPQISIQLSSHN